LFSHINAGSNDVTRTALFYDAFFAPLGITRFWTEETGRIVGWRRGDEGGKFFLCSPFNAEPATAGNGSMCAFSAPSREAVHLAYEAGLAHGGRDDGAPGLRPHYAPDYYGAYLRDPEGNKLHVVHRGGG
jgi:catechol 2,3-dioxygenase-like lactoylglutathione lyase family enzyme